MTPRSIAHDSPSIGARTHASAASTGSTIVHGAHSHGSAASTRSTIVHGAHSLGSAASTRSTIVHGAHSLGSAASTGSTIAHGARSIGQPASSGSTTAQRARSIGRAVAIGGSTCLVGAAFVLATACGPTVKPPEPPAEPGPVSQGVKPIKVDPSGRQVMVGEMCPQGAGGRPAVAPLMMRAVGWNDAAAEVAATVERGSVPRFFVLGVDGKQAGVFDTLGLVEVGINQPVASGTYVGSSPCTYASGGGKPSTSGSTDNRAEDPKCGPVTKGCGIAIGELTQSNEPASSMKLDTGGACMSGNEIAVDIDGDGRIESFPIAGALDGIRAPTQEWLASPTATATCTPTFQVYDLSIAPEPRPGKAADKGTVTIDVLGVVDIDGDGRKELVLAMRFPTVRTIVVYTASENSQRLELAGEATSFAR